MTDLNPDFKSFNLLQQITKAIDEKGYKEPTPIQQKIIPQILKNRDVIAVSQTGTGKTASFTLPVINRLSIHNSKRAGSCRALILVPTRELAVQVGKNIDSYSKYLKLKIVTVLGGVKINPQIQKLQGGTDILIATPGRLLDLIERDSINLDSVETLVLDEADKLLDMGFKDELDSIFKILPKKRQNIMLSATFPNSIRNLSKTILVNPIDIRVKEEITTGENIEEWLYPVDKSKKNRLLLKLLTENRWPIVLVFAKSQNRVERLLRFLQEKDIVAESIHGGKTQAARDFTLDRFKAGSTHVLVATDIASRGIDIKSLPVVINYDLPQVAHNYVHRVGRTGRAGESGLAISFAAKDEFEFLVKIERQIQTFIQRRVIQGFEPVEMLPDSPKIKPLKPKKPKKKKKKN